MKKSEDRIVGIVAYLTLIGFAIGLIINTDKSGDEKKNWSILLKTGVRVICF